MSIYIYTQVYNTENYLPRCIQSVLDQTYTDFVYTLIDNRSTDGSKQILEQYAAQDARIRVVSFDEYPSTAIWLRIARETAKGEYIVNLDSDDWLDPGFLERMVNLAEWNCLDIVCTGTLYHPEGNENVPSGGRYLPKPLVFEKAQYAALFSIYYIFFRTTSAKLIRRRVLMEADLSVVDREKLPYGSDTLSAFAWLRQAERICIDNSTLYHYLVRNQSVSRIYFPTRFKSDTLLYRDGVDFLAQYGSVSKKNLLFLRCVYANALRDTLEVLWDSGLTPDEKLAQYCMIAAHPTTLEVYRDVHPEIDYSRNMLLQQLMAAAEKARNVPESLSAALKTLLPRCGQAVTRENLSLFTRETALAAALRQDDPDKLAEGLLDLIQRKRYTKQYDLGGMLQALARDKPLLREISSAGFMRKYSEIYWMIWQDQTLEALDTMTGLLLENRVQGATDEFLQLYLSLAALLNQVPAVLFGKIKLAQSYLRQRRAEDCRAVLRELEAMGMEENEELTDIRRRLASLGEPQ